MKPFRISHCIVVCWSFLPCLLLSLGLVLLTDPARADAELKQHQSDLEAIKIEIASGDVSNVRHFIEKYYEKSPELISEPSNLINYILGLLGRDGFFLPNPPAIAEAMKTSFFKDADNLEFLIERVRLSLATFDSLNKIVDDLIVSREFYVGLLQEIVLQSNVAALSSELSQKIVFTTCDPLYYRSGDAASLQSDFVELILSEMTRSHRKEILVYVAARALNAECVREIFSPR